MPRSAPTPCACTTVRRTSRSLARTFDAALQGTPLNVTQLAVLRAIERHEGEPLSHVAADLSMDRTSLYRAVSTMQRGRLVSVRDGAGARARTARILADGRRALDIAGTHWATTQRAIVDQFGHVEWAAMVGELQRLAGIAAAVGGTLKEETS